MIAALMRVRSLALVVALAACGSDPPPVARSPVAIVPATPNRDVDILFDFEDSPGSLEFQNNLKNNFPAFLDALSPGGLPSLHIGVVTSDLGTSASMDATPGPSIGTGAGGCAGNGKNGNLQTNGTTLVSGSFISDIANADGTRTTNYTGTLADAFTVIASVGATGCGFEQHLEAAKRALNNNPANAGFLRPSANLAVIVVADEDDCSATHTSLFGSDTATFGPLTSFRCTRFGVTCDDGGTTPDEMNTPGAKSGCHDSTSSPYMPPVSDYKTFFEGLKPDPHQVMVGTIIADPTAVSVISEPPPGGGSPIPQLANACTFPDASGGTDAANPGVRLNALAQSMDRGVSASLCQQDLSGPLVAIARQINSMTGSPCLVRDIVQPADCVVTDDAGRVPACSPDRSTDCYLLVTDPVQCPMGQNLRLERQGTPHGATVVQCTVP